MSKLPTAIQLPAAVPTQDPALAGFLSQLGVQLNQWILQAATAINNAQTTLTIGDWTITEVGDGSLLLTFNGASNSTGNVGGTWVIPNPAGNNLIVQGVAPP